MSSAGASGQESMTQDDERENVCFAAGIEVCEESDEESGGEEAPPEATPEDYEQSSSMMTPIVESLTMKSGFEPPEERSTGCELFSQSDKDFSAELRSIKAEQLRRCADFNNDVHLMRKPTLKLRPTRTYCSMCRIYFVTEKAAKKHFDAVHSKLESEGLSELKTLIKRREQRAEEIADKILSETEQGKRFNQKLSKKMLKLKEQERLREAEKEQDLAAAMDARNRDRRHILSVPTVSVTSPKRKPREGKTINERLLKTTFKGVFVKKSQQPLPKAETVETAPPVEEQKKSEDQKAEEDTEVAEEPPPRLDGRVRRAKAPISFKKIYKKKRGKGKVGAEKGKETKQNQESEEATSDQQPAKKKSEETTNQQQSLASISLNQLNTTEDRVLCLLCPSVLSRMGAAVIHAKINHNDYISYLDVPIYKLFINKSAVSADILNYRQFKIEARKIQERISRTPQGSRWELQMEMAQLLKVYSCPLPLLDPLTKVKIGPDSVEDAAPEFKVELKTEPVEGLETETPSNPEESGQVAAFLQQLSVPIKTELMEEEEEEAPALDLEVEPKLWPQTESPMFAEEVSVGEDGQTSQMSRKSLKKAMGSVLEGHYDRIFRKVTDSERYEDWSDGETQAKPDKYLHRAFFKDLPVPEYCQRVSMEVDLGSESKCVIKHYKCELCSETFADRPRILAHLRSSHQIFDCSLPSSSTTNCRGKRKTFAPI